MGKTDNSPISDALSANYAYTIDLNTGFTGSDNLYVGIEAGNNDFTSNDFATDSKVSTGDALTVHSMYYSFPLGNFDLAVGNLLDNDDLMPTTLSKYSDSFYISSEPLADTGFFSFQGVTGSGIAISRVFESGFNASASIIGTDSATNSAGFLTGESNDVTTLSMGYDTETYGFGFVYLAMDDVCNFTAGQETCANLNINGVASANTYGLGGYITPNDGKTTISLTFNSVDLNVDGFAPDIDQLFDTQLSIDHGWGDGVLSASVKGSEFWNPDANLNLINDYVGEWYEIYYTYPVSDSLEILGGVAWSNGDGCLLYTSPSPRDS